MFTTHDTILGVMIGRQGSVIKSMSEQSNCHMQLAEMNDPYDTKERIMIINGKNGLLPDLIHVRFCSATFQAMALREQPFHDSGIQL